MVYQYEYKKRLIIIETGVITFRVGVPPFSARNATDSERNKYPNPTPSYGLVWVESLSAAGVCNSVSSSHTHTCFFLLTSRIRLTVTRTLTPPPSLSTKP